MNSADWCIVSKKKRQKSLGTWKFPTKVCSDLPGLINKIIEKRQRQKDSVLTKISIDGGGGFLKICPSVFNIDDPIPKMSGALLKKFLESVVRKSFIIGLVQMCLGTM